MYAFNMFHTCESDHQDFLKYTIMLATCIHSTTILCDTFIMYWATLLVIFQEIQCLLNFHYDVGRQGLEIDPCIKFRFPQSFFVSYMHVHMPIKMYWPRLFFVVFREIHNFYHVYVHRVMELYLSTKFVGAAVSEIRESNRNKEKEKKKNLQNGYFQFNTLPRHIIDPLFTRVTF